MASYAPVTGRCGLMRVLCVTGSYKGFGDDFYEYRLNVALPDCKLFFPYAINDQDFYTCLRNSCTPESMQPEADIFRLKSTHRTSYASIDR